MVYYYTIAIIGSLLEPLTYHTHQKLYQGQLVRVALKSKEKEGVVLEQTQQPDFTTSEIIACENKEFSSLQQKTAHFIASYYLCAYGEAYALFHPFSSIKDQCCQTRNDRYTNTIELSAEQQKVFQKLLHHKSVLLFGDTGSGKTEIYMNLFFHYLQQGKTALLLMPEIALTPQIGERLKKQFGDSVVIWHSKLTPKQKKDALKKIYTKEAKVIAGARSALFLPLNDLGVIVVDEEHDDSYKASSKPRYNARDIALYMGKQFDIHVVLGSATPSLNSFTNIPFVRLRGGYHKANKKFIFEKSHDGLTPMVYQALQETLHQNKQAIVFIPTRAHFKYLLCDSCGKTVECVFCSVGMSVHHNINALKCHYCNYTQAIPQVCPHCGSGNLSSSRIGTAEATVQLQEYFSDATIEQFDKDSVSTTKKLTTILKKFNDKKIDILVGTQMLSKGHDYHGVSLVVVLGIDYLLHMGDYRAREKALSLLLQVAGRSGRLDDASVLVQTFHEDFFSYYLNDYQKFLEDEQPFRKDLYPPYLRLCRVLFADKNAQKAQEQMRTMEQRLMHYNDIEIVSAKVSSIQKVANKYRFEILLRAKKATTLICAVRECKTPLAQIDMDPIDFA